MLKIPKVKELKIYTTSNGKNPFVEWLESLQDKTIRYRIKERLDRIALGNMGDRKPVGNGVMEFRFDFGSGYRIYYGEERNQIVLLLCGGDKATQSKDIKKAHSFWADYLARADND
ncbi:MAG: type II toxin-antitoxin system RelE/ParE family toxin [Gammaproteobacteria bacterium]|nr:type II toxin-antitoxin system RelE/ParE family toxin [Gammaproteobacteria bacterium]